MADDTEGVRTTNLAAATEFIAAQAIHQYRARGGRPGKVGSVSQWSAITASVIEALRMAPVEERAAMMGMEQVALGFGADPAFMDPWDLVNPRHDNGERTYWTEARDG